MSKTDLKALAKDFREQADRLSSAADALDPPQKRRRRRSTKPKSTNDNQPQAEPAAETAQTSDP